VTHPRWRQDWQRPQTWPPAAPLVWIVLLLLLVTVLTVGSLNADPIWIDEYWSIYNAGGAHYGPLSPANIFARIANEDIWHVPLYYLLIAGWGHLVGWTPFALRGLSLLLGLLSIALAYRMGRDLHSPTAGIGAAVGIGASAYFLYYFHELRGYTLNVLLAMLAVWSYWRAIHDARPRWMIMLFFLTVLATLYAHYLATLILAGIGLYHLFIARKDARWWMIAAAGVLAFICFVPWLHVTLRAWGEASTPESVAQRDWGPNALTLNLLLVVVFGNGAAALPLLAGWFALPNSGLQWRDSPTFYGVFLLVAVLLITLLLNQLIALFVVLRYLLPLWPVLALLTGIGVATLYERHAIHPVLLLGLWVISGVWSTLTPSFMEPYLDMRLLSKTPWHQLQRQLDARFETGDTAVFLLPDETWYVWQDWVSDFYLHQLAQQGLTIELVESYPYITDREYRQAARALDAPHVWLGYFDNEGDKPLAWRSYDKALNERYTSCSTSLLLGGSSREGLYHLDLYTRIPETPDYPFGNQVGVDLVEPLSVRDNFLNVWIGLAIGGDIDPQAYSVGLHLLDAQGTIIMQRDFGLVEPGAQFRPYRCQQVLFDLSTVPAGEYELNALVYNWQTLERLESLTGESILLGAITTR
jgi:hypothetical protein